MEKIFINAGYSFYLRIEELYWCSHNNCSIVKDNQHNGIKKDIVHNYQFSHVISSKAPFEGIMKSFTEFYSSANKLFIDCNCNKIVD